MFGATALKLDTPLTPMQLLWINLVSDVFPGLGLALEPQNPTILEDPPRDPKEPILTGRDFRQVGSEGAIIAATALAANLLVRSTAGPGPRAAGTTFVALTAAQLMHAFSCRSETRAADGLPPNPALTRTMLALALLTAGAIALPWSRRLLGVAGLRPSDWLVAAGAAAVSYTANESLKARRTSPGDDTAHAEG
jgi:Ca2+-transporting ATPase